MAETVAAKPYFREAYQRRRCIVPVDGFFEWMAVKGSKVKQPYAIAMKDRSPFGIAGVWENWRDPASRNGSAHSLSSPSLRTRSSPAYTTGCLRSSRLTSSRDGSARREPSRPDEAIRADLMAMWPVSTRVNTLKNDDPSLVEAVDLTGPGAN